MGAGAGPRYLATPPSTWSPAGLPTRTLLGGNTEPRAGAGGSNTGRGGAKLGGGGGAWLLEKSTGSVWLWSLAGLISTSPPTAATELA